jgi:hypothetical protein
LSTGGLAGAFNSVGDVGGIAIGGQRNHTVSVVGVQAIVLGGRNCARWGLRQNRPMSKRERHLKR